ncbi:MAG: hypothetical protein R2848_08885 [Thermomicrobiales bacterium]
MSVEVDQGTSWANGDSLRAQKLLGFVDPIVAKVEDRGRQNRIRASRRQSFGQMLQIPCAAEAINGIGAAAAIASRRSRS